MKKLNDKVLGECCSNPYTLVCTPSSAFSYLFHDCGGGFVLDVVLTYYVFIISSACFCIFCCRFLSHEDDDISETVTEFAHSYLGLLKQVILGLPRFSVVFVRIFLPRLLPIIKQGMRDF